MDSSVIRAAAYRFGADLCGFAPIERFEGIAPEHNPKSIFPQAKTVIVLGRRILRGAVRVTEEQSAVSPYIDFGLSMLEDQFLPKTAYDVVLFIETNHFDGVPIFGYDVEAASKVYMADPVEAGKPAPNVYVDIAHAAELAGLGRVGRHGMLITPEFGTLQRLSLVLTDMQLQVDPLCQVNFCEDCQACLDECPYALERKRCAECKTGAIPTNFGHFNAIDRNGAACSRACLNALEKRGLLTRKFQQAFRAEK
ncbi:MAG: epoxyqueuosine reductase [Lentisphaerae bacterium]|nr:epoxyqueuosine reductase [Lentisphaerota bacterium]